MVKAFIKGLLNKKSGDGGQKSKDDVPDELPPLAEEAVKEEENKENISTADNKGAEVEESKKEIKEDAPDELPPLAEEAGKDGEKKGDIATADNKEGEDVSGVLSGLGDDLNKDSDGGSESFGKDEGGEGFFSTLLNITKKQGINKKILDRDLYGGMKNYHSNLSSVRVKLVDKQKLEEEVMKRLDELNFFEKKWKNQKDLIKKGKMTLLEYEKNIRGKNEELKPLLKRLSLYEEAPVGKYFRSNDGVIAKNVLELVNLLKIMDYDVFKVHKTESRNDFVSWVKGIIGNKELAKKLNQAKSKEDMISTIEDFSAGKL